MTNGLNGGPYKWIATALVSAFVLVGGIWAQYAERRTTSLEERVESHFEHAGWHESLRVEVQKDAIIDQISDQNLADDIAEIKNILAQLQDDVRKLDRKLP